MPDIDKFANIVIFLLSIACLLSLLTQNRATYPPEDLDKCNICGTPLVRRCIQMYDHEGTLTNDYETRTVCPKCYKG